MDILKAFSLNDKEYPINIQGSVDEPLFQANQIASILEMNNLRKSMQNFDETDKVVSRGNTPGGMQNITFLTESGLYKILARSIKPIAKPFQEWMVNVIKDLRKTGEYKLKEDHEIEKKLITSPFLASILSLVISILNPNPNPEPLLNRS